MEKAEMVLNGVAMFRSTCCIAYGVSMARLMQSLIVDRFVHNPAFDRFVQHFLST